ncbi:MAG TPA: ATP-binding protein [Anaeromyxobacteraceae bacterium]|nr:ATP-binding protein [Anaeromyxobacteraceae bacterium]
MTSTAQTRALRLAGAASHGPGAAPRSRSSRRLVLLYLAFAVFVLGSAYAYHRAYARGLREDREQELAMIAQLKVEQVAAVRRERLGNARTIHENPGLSHASWPLLERHDPEVVSAHLEGWFAPLAEHYGYADLVVLDDRLDVMARWNRGAAELPTHTRALAARALREGSVLMADPEREPGTNAMMLDVAVPLVASGGRRPDRIVGVLLLRAPVAYRLQPIVDGWPVPSRSGDIVLAGRQGDRLVYFTKPTQRRAPEGSTRPDVVPLSRTDIPAVQAVLGRTGIIEGRDGTGTPVVAAAERVPGSDWVLLAKMEVAEMMAPAIATDRILVIAVLALLASAAVSLTLWWYRQLASARRDVLAHETERLERQFEALFDLGNDAVLVVDQACRIVAANDHAAEIYGWNKDELPGRHAGEVSGRSDAEAEASLRAALERGRVLAEGVHHRRDGTPIPVETSIQSYAVNGSRYALVIVRDISDRRRAEAQLRLTDRLTAMGALAAGVAHEINNPLSFVLGNVEWALERVAQGEDPRTVATALEEARDGARRVQAIVRDLKTFSRSEQDPDSRRPVDVVPVLRSSLNIAQNQLRHRARLVTDLQPVPPVAASEQRLGQVFLNLLINAAQAIPRNAAAENDIYVGTHRAPDGSAVIEIRDSGEGMTPEVMRRIFDPFFTTKSGEGTGLGLSICHDIVRSLGGSIEVDSAVGRGSTFRVVLPPASRPSAPPATAHPAEHAKGSDGAARVLIVDDEPLVASSAARLLGRAHHVVTATSAHDALARIEGGEDFDVILCDLMMPEMTGMELWAALARLHPGMERRMVFITGGTFTERARDFLETTANAWLEKPFESGALRDAVAEQLRRARLERSAG